MQVLLEGFHAEDEFPGATVADALPDGTLETVATGLTDVEVGMPMSPLQTWTRGAS